MFILNTGRTALGFVVNIKGREITIEFDKRRYYRDSGNMATDGITEISEEVFKELKKQKFFEEVLVSGDFKVVDNPTETEADTVKAKDDEIAKLRKELAQEKKKNATKELQDKDNEIKSLKEKLEALTATPEAENAEEVAPATETPTTETPATEAPATDVVEGF